MLLQSPRSFGRAAPRSADRGSPHPTGHSQVTARKAVCRPRARCRPRKDPRTPRRPAGRAPWSTLLSSRL
eukprot:5823788-Prymnesium_polylepis.1